MNYGEARAKQETQRTDDAVTYLPCSFCRKHTLTSILSQYGARCVECFDAYCREVGPAIPAGASVVKPDRAKLARFLRKLSANIRSAQSNPRAWADRLREREDAGEVLTGAQRMAYMTAHGAGSVAFDDDAA